jgi:hypothetical protein
MLGKGADLSLSNTRPSLCAYGFFVHFRNLVHGNGGPQVKVCVLICALLGVTAGWTAEGSEFESRWSKNFLSISSRPALGSTQPSVQRVMVALSPGLKRQGREADHSPPTTADVYKTRIYTSTPRIRLHGLVLS